MSCTYISFTPEPKTTFFVQPPQGRLITCTSNLKMENAFELLKQRVHAESGIPSQFHHIFYKNRHIKDTDSLRAVPNEALLTLSIGLLGGNNECNVCYEKSQYFCHQCNHYLCTDCNIRVHKHPKRSKHSPKNLGAPEDQSSMISTCSSDDEYDMEISPSFESSFVDAELIATLAEKFKLTSFKSFQKKIIEATLAGEDTLVLYPTGSGKSLCFQFPPVYLNKKAIIVTPTISLMQDQVAKLNGLGLKSVYLGSAQCDKLVESKSLDPESDVIIIFVTPEWITKPDNQRKVRNLEKEKKLALIALDEAHLISEWADFRNAFCELKDLKDIFVSTPLMALSATATAEVEAKIRNSLRNPVTEKRSINRPNVTLNVEELHQEKGVDATMQFAIRAAEIAGTAPAIIYTDFISDIGPIISSLLEIGKDAVGYHGEMDPSERLLAYNKWSSGEVNIIVATKAFGMGIDKPDIRNVIRNGVPESVLSWTQELGRAGRDGMQACATILYRRSDVSHANPWVLNNLKCKERCNEILLAFSNSWKYVQAHLSGVCRRRSLLDLFGEVDTETTHQGSCCDVCTSTELNQCPQKNMKQELAIVIDALDKLGCKGEVKITEWIRGTKLSWTNEFDKTAMSYGNHLGKGIDFWRTFLRQCYVNGYVQMELRSLIKGNGHYSVYGVYFPTEKGRCVVEEKGDIMLPQSHDVYKPSQTASHSRCTESNAMGKHKRIGKGSHILPIVRRCLQETENWKHIQSKQDYHFPGVYTKTCQHINNNLFYTPDYTQLEQSAEDPHFMWRDIQFSKGPLNKDRKIEVEMNGKEEKLCYRTAPCNGVKYCTISGCEYTAPVRDKRPCPQHNNLLTKTSSCPVEFVYVHPVDNNDKRRWIGGLIRCPKESTDNLHNHSVHAPTAIAQCIKEKISKAVFLNPTLKPSDIACGKGVGFVPSAVDVPSSHLGKVTREVKKAKEMAGMTSKDWSPSEFEAVADKIDKDDEVLSGTCEQDQKMYKTYGRPYLVSAGFEDGINYLFTMSPLMNRIADNADFMQCDVTYDETREYPYLFNAVVFNDTLMEWMIIGRIRLNKQNSNAYRLAFKKLLEKCPSGNLLGLVVDWSDAQIKGLQLAVGNEKAEKLLKGCRVHWLRSCQRVAERISHSNDRQRERDLFVHLAKQIPSLGSVLAVIACFEALCGVRQCTVLQEEYPYMCNAEDARFIDENCDWSPIKHWAQWWTRSTHLKMLSHIFSCAPESWKNCPTTTNAVERKNRECKTDRPLPLRLAMMNVYKMDKSTCCKHIAAERGTSVSYRSRDEESRKKNAESRRRQRTMVLNADRMAQHGPPDRCSNFRSEAGGRKLKNNDDHAKSPAKKLAISVDNTTISFVPNPHPEVMGKKVKVKFMVEDLKREEWFIGIITTYNGLKGEYGIFFPSDKQTVEMALDDRDLEFIDN